MTKKHLTQAKGLWRMRCAVSARLSILTVPIPVGGFVLAGLVALSALFIMAASQPLRAATYDHPVFFPAGSWLVSPSQPFQQALAGGDGQKSCVMANQFDNGFILRFLGGEGRLSALTVDFRQNVFQRGYSYAGSIYTEVERVAGVRGVAQSPSILVFEFSAPQRVYDALTGKADFRLAIAGNTFSFSLSGFSKGVRRLENCVNPPAPQNLEAELETLRASVLPPVEEVAIAGRTTPLRPVGEPIDLLREGPQKTEGFLAGGEPMVVALSDDEEGHEQREGANKGHPEAHKGADELLELSEAQDSGDIADLQKLSEKGSNVADEADVADWEGREGREEGVLAVAGKGETQKAQDQPKVQKQEQKQDKTVARASAPAHPSIQDQIWTARKGEDIKIVLARWSERAGFDLVWESDAGGRLQKDVRYKGSYEKAVEAFINSHESLLGVAAHLEGLSTADQLETQDEKQAQAPGSPVYSKLLHTPLPPPWEAKKGEALYDVFARWTARRNIRLVWRAGSRFRVKESLKVGAGFGTAVESLLEQYGAALIRPVGQLNTDPLTGEEVLFIDSYISGGAS